MVKKKRSSSADRRTAPPTYRAYRADARELPLSRSSVDLIVTSPPYYRQRDYRATGQIGLETSPEEYVTSIHAALGEMRRVLTSQGSIFLNVGDTYHNRSLIGIPALIEEAARDLRLFVRNRIVWAKNGGVPSAARNRLANRHEYVLHLTKGRNYYYDLLGYSTYLEKTGNPGDVWTIPHKPNRNSHLAPFPEELVRRAVMLACPPAVCTKCNEPRHPIARRGRKLNPSRVQARRAMQLAKDAGLTNAHIAAIQATGIADAGKGSQTHTGRNSPKVKQLAAEAKEILGGYFREFTFPIWEQRGFTACRCKARFRRGVVLDPFAGTGTTLRVAAELGRSAIGADLHRVRLPKQ